MSASQQTEPHTENSQEHSDQSLSIMNSENDNSDDKECCSDSFTSGSDSSIIDVRKSTPLHTAAESGDLERLRILLDSGTASVNAVDNKGGTVLHSLLLSGATTTSEKLKQGIELLISHGADVNIKDKKSETPLHLVFHRDTSEIPEIVKYFLRIAPNYDMTLKNADGHTVFHVFMTDIVNTEADNFTQIIDGKEKFINEFIQGNIITLSQEYVTVLLNDKNSMGYSSFHTYIDHSHYSQTTVKMLIKAGAYVNTANNIGITPLMSASSKNRKDVLEILLHAGADVNAEDIFRRTALYHVNSKCAFDLLCKFGINVNVQDRFGVSPLVNVRIYTPENLPYSGITVSSAFSDVAPLAKYFVDRNADFNTVDQYDSTLLHYAAWFSDPQMICFLLNRKADQMARDRNGMTPYELALHHGNYHIADLLRGDQQPLDSMSESVQSVVNPLDYVRMIVNEDEVKNVKSSLENLGVYIDPSELLNKLMVSPILGLVDRRSETWKIKDTTNDLMRELACLVSQMDARFHCSVFPTGSSSEGTQVGDPVEYDFVFNLDFISEHCKIVQPDELLDSGFAYLQLKKCEDSCGLIPFANDNDMICSEDVRCHFQDLVIAALNNKQLWKSKNLYFDGYVSLPEDKPILNLRVTWFGPVIKLLEISIDIVPAVHTSGWLPREIHSESFTLFSNKVIDKKYFLLLHTPEKQSDYFGSVENFVRISSAPTEIKYLQNMTNIYRESYGISKILKGIHFCPSIQFSEEDDNSISDDSSQSVDNRMKMGNNEATLSNHNIVGTVETIKGHGGQILENTCTITEISKDDVVGNQSGVRRFEKAEPGYIEPVYGWLAAIDDTRKIKKLLVLDSKETKLQDKNELKEITTSDQDGAKCFFISHKRQDKISQEKTQGNEKNSKKQRKNDQEICKEINIESAGKDVEYPNKSEQTTQQDHDLISEVSCSQDEANMADDNASRESAVHDCEEIKEIICSQDDTSMADSNESSPGGSETLSSDFEYAGNIVKANDEISSYMLKNCLFYVIQEIQLSNEKASDLSHLHVVRRVYEHLHMCACKKQLRVYCLPSLDIFSYVTTHIRMIPKEKADSAIAEQCKRIAAFCELILTILS